MQDPPKNQHCGLSACSCGARYTVHELVRLRIITDVRVVAANASPEIASKLGVFTTMSDGDDDDDLPPC
jgi:hypothetical protein